MKMETLMLVGGLILAVVLIVCVIFIPGRRTMPFEENLYGIDYNIEGNETKITGVKSDKPLVAMYIENYGSVIFELYPKYS